MDALVQGGANADVALNAGAGSLSGATPLYVAAQRGHLDVVRTLLEAGADANKASDGGHSPLYFAAQNGRVDVLSILLQGGADANRPTEIGVTPLLIAAQQGPWWLARRRPARRHLLSAATRLP